MEKSLYIKISIDDHKAIKMHCATVKTTMQKFIVEAAKEKIAKDTSANQ